MSDVVLQGIDLHKRYQEGRGSDALDVTVLRGVNLSVQRGQTLAVVGASGSGKSSLLHVLGLLDRADAGTVCIAGQATEGLGEGARSGVPLGLTAQVRQILGEIQKATSGAVMATEDGAKAPLPVPKRTNKARDDWAGVLRLDAMAALSELQAQVSAWLRTEEVA